MNVGLHLKVIITTDYCWMGKQVRVSAKDGVCVALLNPFTFISAGQTKQAIRQYTQTAAVKYLVSDKRPVTGLYSIVLS